MRIHLVCIHKRISCVYKRDLLCMHNTLVHAVGQGPQGPGTQKRRWAGPGPWTAPFLGPWPLGSLAQSMHKSVVHAKEISCVYTRDSFVYTQEILYYYIVILSYHHMVIWFLSYYMIIVFYYYYIIILFIIIVYCYIIIVF